MCKVIAYLSVVNATEKNVEWKEDKQLRYIRAVSYTHLDVYKRQVKDWTSYLGTVRTDSS